MLTDEEARIVEYIGDRYSRRDIALLMDQSESVTRALIRRMCEAYGCSTRELPARTLGDMPSEFSRQ